MSNSFHRQYRKYHSRHREGLAQRFRRSACDLLDTRIKPSRQVLGVLRTNYAIERPKLSKTEYIQNRDES